MFPIFSNFLRASCVRQIRACSLSLAALLCLSASTALAQLTVNEREPAVGDVSSDPGPLAHLSRSTQPIAVQTAMRKVANWQFARTGQQFSQDWTFATLYLGMLEASTTLNDSRYSNYVLGVANHYRFHLGPRRLHADDQAIGQSYLWLYTRDRKSAELAPLQTQFDEVMQTPDDPQKPVWWWCDALFMAPPVWAQLANVTHQSNYLDYMDREWHITSNLLWDPQEHLFFRDKSYFDKREANGQKIFWSRGNGWVMGGLARILTFMPSDDPRRPFYLDKFRQMSEKIRSIQDKDGLWRPGLLDAAHYPYPEISGSAFFVYALAWGVNQGILDRATYKPAAERGWAGLIAHIYRDGRL
ncbi:MAG TPA: glycoside hydrolase family 88 protein, partial [Bryobacteraceae bacterium]|nr:glycoside hydrolase family 88 protein [Bryobacteraceae bacterium]